MTTPDPECEHADTTRGEDIPRRYGSYRSEVCSACGAFRTLTHHDDPVGLWRPKAEYAAAIERHDDE